MSIIIKISAILLVVALIINAIKYVLGILNSNSWGKKVYSVI